MTYFLLCKPIPTIEQEKTLKPVLRLKQIYITWIRNVYLSEEAVIFYYKKQS